MDFLQDARDSHGQNQSFENWSIKLIGIKIEIIGSKLTESLATLKDKFKISPGWGAKGRAIRGGGNEWEICH